jgi:hypothetical protein
VRAEEAQGPPQLHAVRVLQEVARHIAEVVGVQREGLHRSVHKNRPQRRGVVLLGPGEKRETLMREKEKGENKKPSTFARENFRTLRGTSLRIRADRADDKDEACKKTAFSSLETEYWFAELDACTEKCLDFRSICPVVVPGSPFSGKSRRRNLSVEKNKPLSRKG